MQYIYIEIVIYYTMTFNQVSCKVQFNILRHNWKWLSLPQSNQEQHDEFKSPLSDQLEIILSVRRMSNDQKHWELNELAHTQ